MQILVNHDDHIKGDINLIQYVEAEVHSVLGRHAERITRVEAKLGDENGDKSGANDKRCLIEARPSGLQPIVVTHHAPSLREAIDGAIERLEKVVSSTFDRLSNPKGNTSYSGDPDLEQIID